MMCSRIEMTAVGAVWVAAALTGATMLSAEANDAANRVSPGSALERSARGQPLKGQPGVSP